MRGRFSILFLPFGPVQPYHRERRNEPAIRPCRFRRRARRICRQRLTPPSTAWRSISFSSSGVNDQIVERLDAVGDLLRAARANERRCHALVSERPGQRHLGERLAAPPRDRVELARALEIVGRQHGLLKETIFSGAAANGHARQIFVSQHALRQRRKTIAPTPSASRVSSRSVVLDPAIEHRIARLVDQAGRAEPLQERGRLGVRANCRMKCRHRAPCPAAPR